MGIVLTKIVLLGGKALVNALSTYSFEYFCKNPIAINFLSNYAADIIDKGAEVIETDKKDKEKLFQTFQNLLNQLIRETIIETNIPEDMQEWIYIELIHALNRIEIPAEKCLGNGLGEFLCKEYYKVTSVSKNEVIDNILPVYADKYKNLFWDVYSNKAEGWEAVDGKFAEHDVELAKHRDILANYEGRISVLETSFGNDRGIANPEYIELYYDSLVEEFEKEEASFLGHKSLRDTYIPPRIKDGGDMKLEVYKWFRSTEYGVFLLYGHPGHGKTSFCKKFVYDYALDNPKRATDAEVLQFPLNPAYSGIIVANEIKLENCINDGSDDGSRLLSWEECRGKLIFLDGFDELLHMMAKETRVKSYCEFSKIVAKIAQKYKIHFVVTSRINAVTSHDCEQLNAYEFAELSFEEQRDWCLVHNPEYWNTYLHNICKGKDSSSVNDSLYSLLKIPYIFRMVAEHEYVMSGTIKNRAALFSDLFSQTIGRAERHYNETELFNPDTLNSSFQNLAYDIWCDNCDSAEREGNNKQLLLLTYYVKENDTKGRISFFHKSFYDYFLSLYFYNKLKESIKNNSPNIILEKLAERRVEYDIIEFISELKENDTNPEKDPIDEAELKLILNRIEESECIGIDTKDRIEIKGNAETLKYDRCNNIFVNALNILFCFDIVQIFNELKQTKKLMGRFSCSNLEISCGSEKVDLSNCVFRRADLRGADLSIVNLIGADFRGADLREADLSGADLIFADLSGADFRGADLSGADFSETDLRRADFRGADLSGADFSEADFRGADLSGVDFSETDLSEADFRGADLSGADFSEADLSEANLRGAVFVETRLRKKDYKQLISSGVDLRGVCIVE